MSVPGTKMIPVSRPSFGTGGRSRCCRSAPEWMGNPRSSSRGVRAASSPSTSAPTHAVAVSSCTTALHLALVAAGIKAGDEVLCPSLSFIATANAIVHAGAVPVFVDIDEIDIQHGPELHRGCHYTADQGHSGRSPDRIACCA